MPHETSRRARSAAKWLFARPMSAFTVLVACTVPKRPESARSEPATATTTARTATTPSPSPSMDAAPLPASANAPPPEVALLPGEPPIPSAPPSCLDTARDAPFVYVEPGGPRALFSVNGYLARTLRIVRGQGRSTTETQHCLTVLWPAARTNNEGSACSVVDAIDAGWFRAIENTLARVPLAHVRTLRRIVIDNRPREHGIAAFDRGDPNDARDGATIWLHEHLFRDPNHWARGNHGSYWSYHTNEDQRVFDGATPDHDLFSPVLLHELGHIVMYNVINRRVHMADTPECARTCADMGTCERISMIERESGCVSPYCSPFQFQAGTENWAEQYRFHYQSAITRSLLARSHARCGELLLREDAAEDASAPWERGLPDIAEFRRSLWRSCGGRACKGW